MIYLCGEYGKYLIIIYSFCYIDFGLCLGVKICYEISMARTNID